MASFDVAFGRTVRRWEKFALTDRRTDLGGQTYAGISRRWWPGWSGWALIDQNQPVPEALVADFYRQQFWDAIEGDALRHQEIADVIFDWAVNAGVQRATQFTARVLSMPTTLSMPALLRALNALSPPHGVDWFANSYALLRIAYREQRVTRRPDQAANLLGWVRRDLDFALIPRVE